ncbi:MAG: hypothetical protein HFG68_14640 [Hungatella sp.]|nr:hypothetical protein [Hungatella sp.]
MKLCQNRRNFIEGEDFFQRNSLEAQNEFRILAPNGLILITESGYLMLVKSFSDDLAWDIQRQLVRKYFTPERAYMTLTDSASSLEGATNAGRLFERIMRSEGIPPHEIAKVVRSIFLQAGINIPSYVVKIPAYEQLTLDGIEVM